MLICPLNSQYSNFIWYFQLLKKNVYSEEDPDDGTEMFVMPDDCKFVISFIAPEHSNIWNPDLVLISSSLFEFQKWKPRS